VESLNMAMHGGDGSYQYRRRRNVDSSRVNLDQRVGACSLFVKQWCQVQQREQYLVFHAPEYCTG
jgi:hypothetical protein